MIKVKQVSNGSTVLSEHQLGYMISGNDLDIRIGDGTSQFRNLPQWEGELPLSVDKGGTGATSAVDARENLKILTMTEVAYNLLSSKDANTIYICY